MESGSPTFPDKRSIKKLYFDLEYLFDYINEKYIGQTFRDYIEKN